MIQPLIPTLAFRIVRTGSEWSRYASENPFAEASESEPNLVMLAISKKAPAPGALERLRERAVSGERIEQRGDAIWILYGNGAAKSKLSPGLLDRIVGSPVTTRTWRTVLRLAELARPREKPR